MHIINARLRNREGLHDLQLEHGRIASITPQTATPPMGPDDLDAAGNLVVPPLSSRISTLMPPSLPASRAGI